MLKRIWKLIPLKLRKLLVTPIFREIIWILTFSIIVFWTAQKFDAFEQLVEFSLAHEDWELDELFTLLIISSFALMIIAFRKSRYLRQEITQRINAEKKIKTLAFYDTLTGLPNRDLYNIRIEHSLAQAARTHSKLAVLFIDLDNFKEVNDCFGHDAGDELLKQVANKLASQIRQVDTLARFAGDEFIIVLEDVINADNVTAFTQKLLSRVREPFDLLGNLAHIGMSVGVALYPDDAKNSIDLLKKADTAMYHSKNVGKNTIRFFSRELDEHAQNKLKIASLLRYALDNKEFTLHYQPIFDSNSQKLKGAEALLRWNNKELGNVPPDVFIPIAEHIGIITDIGNWVLYEACHQGQAWYQDLDGQFSMSVNMSAKQLDNDFFMQTVKDCLDKTKLSPQSLELELTETIIMNSIGHAIQRLNKLKSLGISISLDDFGTGYSSMGYLTKLNISRIKIDRSFISKIHENEEERLTVNAIISLAKSLELEITAEGIENTFQHDFIANSLTDAVQGYYYGKPLPAKEFKARFIHPLLEASVDNMN